MKKKHVIYISVVLVILVSIGVVIMLNRDKETKPAKGQEITTIETTTTALPITSESEPSTVSLEDVSISYPEEYSTDINIPHYTSEKKYRFGYYGTQSIEFESIDRNEMSVWLAQELAEFIISKQELAEPALFTVIKHYNITFNEFDRASKKLYLNFEGYANMSNEEYEIPNPYILYTFNLEKINDYYSLDPARYASARKWLEEWLKTNKPYNSYSEYQQSNAD